MQNRCPDYDFLYLSWTAACQLSETDAREAKAALVAHAAECEFCTQAVRLALAASVALPEVAQ